MDIRYPIHAHVDANPEAALERLATLVDGVAVRYASPGLSHGPLVLVGPRRNEAANRLIALRTGQPEISPPTEAAPEPVVAWAVHLSPQTPSAQAPVVMVYRFVPALGGAPVLITENRMIPGELVFVPESSETIVTIALYPECDPAGLTWHSVIGSTPASRSLPSIAITAVREPEGPTLQPDCIALSAPLFGKEEPAELDLLGEHCRSVQVAPVLDWHEHEVLQEYLSRAPWQRREGDIYSQDSLDIVQWVLAGDGPRELVDLVERLQSTAVVKRVARLTGQAITKTHEVFSYRLRPGERILVHSDSTEGGELLLRINWLVASPTGREFDMRFWDPENPQAPVQLYSARPNSATVFLLGDETPHDVAPIPWQTEESRYNFVLTFGN